MRLTVIGCSGSMSGPSSPSSCYLVQAEGPGESGPRTWNVLLDLGSGAFGALLGHLDPAELDMVVLSHLHADHIVDMTGLQVYRRYHPAGALRPVRVLGPDDTARRIRAVSGDEDDEDLSAEFAIETFAPGTVVEVGPLRIEPFEVEHPLPAYGVRVTGPREDGTGEGVLAYTGDTDLCEGLGPLARGADLLLAEAAFQEGRDAVRGVHLTGRRAGQVAAAGEVAGLVLTHQPPWNDPAVAAREAAEVFDGPIELAAPGAVWAI
ncbi:MBL fold metallo-hydrolase [Georgenia faecalis]|uniref:MBL fold metallo-hydrolase n=1 Tax=Georgenia faecalis TaxID=2483799 RepID=A0ABV9DCS9_9MICO|nr:MBL fold metallo-hydrolase [Georgenia faecalis]